VVDRVLTRVGASDNLAKGESTFMVEMKETASVLERATERSLVVLDEIGRGTSTFDGLALASAIAEYLHDTIKCRTLFATHYHELTALADRREGIQNYCVLAKEHAGNLVFLHDIRRGVASQSFGVACARLAGMPEGVLVRASMVLAELEEGKYASQSGASSASDSVEAKADVAKPKRPSVLGAASKRAGEPQLSLFAPEHPALQALRQLDPERMTPLDALKVLTDLRKSLG
jgi:DNA mismatch repair protein MutS